MNARRLAARRELEDAEAALHAPQPGYRPAPCRCRARRRRARDRGARSSRPLRPPTPFGTPSRAVGCDVSTRVVADVLPARLFVHHRDARVDVADGRAVVEERLALARSIPVVHRHRAAFELERRRDAVARLELVAFEGLRVGVRVDEPRRDDEARRRRLWTCRPAAWRSLRRSASRGCRRVGRRRVPTPGP